MIRINLLVDGDEFAGLYKDMIAIRKKNGEVEFRKMYQDENGCIRVADEPEICIGYGHNEVEISLEEHVKVVTF